MTWTPPKTWTPGEDLTAGELNTHLRDNTAFLYGAKHGTFGRLAALSVATSTWVAVAWDFALEQTPTMWSSSANPDRITPPLGGIWHVSALIRWEASSASGTRAVRLQKNGSILLAQERDQMLSNATQYITASAVVRLSGSDWIDAAVWQNTGSTESLVSSVHRSIALTWMGA
jgi:hypothetical protein